MQFSDLGLSETLTSALSERNYAAPTPIQEATIPTVLERKDVWACAQTGSGKTAAFALPILQRLLDIRPVDLRRPFALVIVPTRELATQVEEFFQLYSQNFSETLKIVTAIGGVSINPQMMALRGGAHIIIATPGRLLELVEKNAVRLKAASILVLDEADRLLELGFEDELGRLIKLLSPRRQNLFFSATYPDEVKALAESILNEPLQVGMDLKPVTPSEIVERVIEVDVERRTRILRHLIEENVWSRVLVFAASSYATEHIAQKLLRLGIEAAPLHGKLSQGARTEVLQGFKDSEFQVLVATDLVARGIDIVQMPVVVNYDLPRSPAAYMHRIGRTGRAGEGGLAISFVSAETNAHLKLIEKKIERTLPREQLEAFVPNRVVVPEKPKIGGIKGKRKSKKDKLREAAAKAAEDLKD
mgnify:CR=1 FL=1|tara:strand:+ start:27083 stop:28333 length:1251 start_codon:yes stop_codon:yes gene_type:complete